MVMKYPALSPEVIKAIATEQSIRDVWLHGGRIDPVDPEIDPLHNKDWVHRRCEREERVLSEIRAELGERHSRSRVVRETTYASGWSEAANRVLSEGGSLSSTPGEFEFRLFSGVVWKVSMPEGSSREDWETQFDMLAGAADRLEEWERLRGVLEPLPEPPEGWPELKRADDGEA
jgi:hypothetical protein